MSTYETKHSGENLYDVYPQDQMANGQADFVRHDEFDTIITTFNLDHAIDNGIETGKQADGTIIRAPYCLMCGQAMYGLLGVACPECSKGLEEQFS